MLGAEGYKQRQRGIIELRLWLSRFVQCLDNRAAASVFMHSV